MPDEVPAAPRAAPVEGAIDRSHAGEAAPATAFKDASGKAVTIARFAGKPVLVNLWATWCAPCVKELPSLDVLAGAQANIAVIAVSQDQDGMAKVGPFVARGGYRHLPPYLDTESGLSFALGANLPTTVLYDAKGRELWRVAGGRDWASAESRALFAGL
ncbi:TlpA family protein disulfide reductase [Sphingomonas sp.]|uniref:TlpA family protein disulfide reductase n=1 Tax=Sphingomonas sp. TaxID=28214 RepID=UPI00345C3E2F